MTNCRFVYTVRSVAPNKLRFHKLKYVLPLFVCLSEIGCSTRVVSGANNSNTIIDNTVNDCIQVRLLKRYDHNNLLILDGEISHTQSVSYCGCKSALLSYYAMPKNNENTNQPTEYHLFSSLREGIFSFILDSDYTIGQEESYKLNIQCASSG